MSTNAELRQRLARLGPVRDANPPPSYSGDLIALVLRLIGPLDKPIIVAKRLYAAGLTLRSAHTVINRLAEARLAVCRIAEGADLPALSADLHAMNVHTFRRRQLDPALIAQVRTRHGLSQREFSEIIGVEIDTLQNWEQGRNRPDAAVLTLLAVYDRNPDLVLPTMFEPVV
jgi:DNA-binding transcriptional regulator YiaG